MFGMGEVGPETTQGTLEYLTKKEKRYPHLVDDAGKWTARSDVRYVQVMPGEKCGMQTLHNEWLTVRRVSGMPALAEPMIHVPGKTFANEVATAEEVGLRSVETPWVFGCRAVVLERM
jgi:hypothetical protein